MLETSPLIDVCRSDRAVVKVQRTHPESHRLHRNPEVPIDVTSCKPTGHIAEQTAPTLRSHEGRPGPVGSTMYLGFRMESGNSSSDRQGMGRSCPIECGRTLRCRVMDQQAGMSVCKRVEFGGPRPWLTRSLENRLSPARHHSTTSSTTFARVNFGR